MPRRTSSLHVCMYRQPFHLAHVRGQSIWAPLMHILLRAYPYRGVLTAELLLLVSGHIITSCVRYARTVSLCPAKLLPRRRRRWRFRAFCAYAIDTASTMEIILTVERYFECKNLSNLYECYTRSQRILLVDVGDFGSADPRTMCAYHRFYTWSRGLIPLRCC